MWLVILGCSRGEFAKFRSLRVDLDYWLKLPFKWLNLIGWLNLEGLLANKEIVGIRIIKKRNYGIS